MLVQEDYNLSGGIVIVTTFYLITECAGSSQADREQDLYQLLFLSDS